VFAPLTPVSNGLASTLRWPVLFQDYGGYLSRGSWLDRDQEAGCVEQPKHIRLLWIGAGNFGRTTCFFLVKYQPQERAQQRVVGSQQRCDLPNQARDRVVKKIVA
jgi:hypothetical protein